MNSGAQTPDTSISQNDRGKSRLPNKSEEKTRTSSMEVKADKGRLSDTSGGDERFLACCPCHVTLDQRACTPAWCMSYRYLDWMLTVAVVLLSTWGSLCIIVGPVAYPGGALFAFLVITLLAYTVGWFGYYQFHLPANSGMLIVGLLYRNTPLWTITDPLDASILQAAKSLMLTISLVKAGLYFDGGVFRTFGLSIVLLGTVPCLTEVVIVAVLGHYLLTISLHWAFLLGSMLAGVSAVQMALTLSGLSNKGYGTKTGILSILLAASTIDNNVVITIYGILSMSMRDLDNTWGTVLQALIQPVCSALGGCLLGTILAFLPNRHHRYALLSRFLLLLSSCVCVHLACRQYNLHTAAYLCNVFTAGFMVNVWRVMRWSEDALPLRELLEMLWHACQPAVNTMVAMSIDFASMATDTVWRVLILYHLGVLFRFAATYNSAYFSRKPRRQRLFMALAWSSKGMLQSTLLALAGDIISGDAVLREKINTSVYLTIVIGAFTCTLSMKIMGKRLLPKQA